MVGPPGVIRDIMWEASRTVETFHAPKALNRYPTR